MSQGFFKYALLKEQIFSKLNFDNQGRLMLGNMYIIILPRYIISKIQREVENIVGDIACSLIMYKVGFDIGYNVASRIKGNNKGIILRKFINTLASRGWGNFELENCDLNTPLIKVKVNSCYAEDLRPSKSPQCHLIRGLLSGAVQYLVGDNIKVKGVEHECIAMGHDFCRIEIRPT